MKCNLCKKSFKPEYNNMKYCSGVCRRKTHYAKFGARYQRDIADKLSIKPAKNKIQCLICGHWYRQVGTHIVLRHEMTAREYREHFNLEVKKGMLPPDYREFKAQQCLENGTWKNLKVGKKFWFKKGSKIAGHYKRSPITLERLRHLKQNYGNKK